MRKYKYPSYSSIPFCDGTHGVLAVVKKLGELYLQIYIYIVEWLSEFSI